MTNYVENSEKLEDICGELLDPIDMCGNIDACVKYTATEGPSAGRQFVIGLTKDSLVLVRMPENAN